MIYTTENCNLTCSYCESLEARNGFEQKPLYKNEEITNFLKKIPDLNMHFYGGEPLLNKELIDYLIKNVPHTRATLQTNGQLLHKMSSHFLNKFETISVSLDGPREITDKYRGKGVYDKSINNIKKIRKEGYNNFLNVRMTISPGEDILKSVTHFIDGCEVQFDNIHWQLNVLFHNSEWVNNKEEIKKWFKEDYNPKIKVLIKSWVKEMIDNAKVIKIVPFIGIIHSLFTNNRVENLRCGAGWNTWAITTTGDIYGCPVMREYENYSLGKINNVKPEEIKPSFDLVGCKNCDVFSLCGGRCLCSNLENEWDKEGYDLVCESVKYLIRNLVKVYPIIKKLVDNNKISISDFESYHDYEVIP